MAKARKRTASTALSQRQRSTKRVKKISMAANSLLTGSKGESLESTDQNVQPGCSDTIEATLSELNKVKVAHSSAIPAARSKHTSISSKHGKNFMDLPRELRDMMYYFALVPPPSPTSPANLTRQNRKTTTSVRLALRKHVKWNRLKRDIAALGVDALVPEPSPHINTSLFCTNRTMRDEAEAVFYKHNTFTLCPSWFRDSKPGERRQLSVTTLSKLQKLYVADWCSLLTKCPKEIRAMVRIDEDRITEIRMMMGLWAPKMEIDKIWGHGLMYNLAVFPALRELTLAFSWTRLITAWDEGILRFIIGKLHEKMEERQELGLPPVRVHVCEFRLRWLKDNFKSSGWFEPVMELDWSGVDLGVKSTPKLQEIHEI